MLTQRMTWLALNDPLNPDLQYSISLFEQTLFSLKEGGESLDSLGRSVQLPRTKDPESRLLIDHVEQSWVNFRLQLDNPSAQTISTQSALILGQMDAVVSAYEQQAEEKLGRLGLIQSAFLIAAIFLVSQGVFLTRKRIIHPLNSLGEAVKQISSGNLESPLPELSPGEFRKLSHSFESMRQKLVNSRDFLETKVARRTKELSTAFEFSQDILAQRDESDLIDSVVERARVLLDGQSAALCILTPDGNALEMLSNNGMLTFENGNFRTTEIGYPLQVIGQGNTVTGDTNCDGCRFLSTHERGQCIVSPLKVGDQVYGALCVVRHDDHSPETVKSIDRDEQRALSLLANSAALAIQNAKLTLAEREIAEQSAAELEREKLASDLHDDLAQTLSYTRMKLEELEENLSEHQGANINPALQQISAAVNKAYQQLREALTGIMAPPQSIDEFKISLFQSIEMFEMNSGIEANILIKDDLALELPDATQKQLLFIINEALSNIRQHAEAKHVNVQIDFDNSEAHYLISDDGLGFDQSIPMEESHFGLHIMRTRVERSGGNFQLISKPGSGTVISCKFPTSDELIQAIGLQREKV